MLHRTEQNAWAVDTDLSPHARRGERSGSGLLEATRTALDELAPELGWMAGPLPEPERNETFVAQLRRAVEAERDH